ncbi:MAG: fibro-slime domain-containing protein [Phycisphaeraceae bacterium]|nr:fibro-slime domain-containing protein [Phycisphaeraceae bacterium]
MHPSFTRARAITSTILLLAGAACSLGLHAEPPELPSSIQLVGVARDFKERSVSGGHDDFELDPSGGFGQYAGIVGDTLDSSGRPVYKSTGYRVTKPAKDSKGRPIINSKSYIASVSGDSSATISSSTGGAVTNKSKFNQWFKTTKNVNTAINVPLTLRRVGLSNTYTFDSATDPAYSALGGFFPINKKGFGNSSGDNKNFHFTFELATQFVYTRNSGQVFTFSGDDDVWVFIDGRLVIDLGGIHGRLEQTIDLDRLTWLKDGDTYSLRFFFAERHRTESNFRITTTLNLVDTGEVEKEEDTAPPAPKVWSWTEVDPG